MKLIESKFVLLLASIMLVAAFQRAGAQTWDGGGSDNNWSTGANWVGDSAPANDGTANVLFAGSNSLTPDVDTAWNINRLQFNSASSFTIGGSTITLNSTSTLGSGSAILYAGTGTGTQTISANLVQGSSGGAMAINTGNNGNLIITGNINENNNKIYVLGGANKTITLSGIISGSGNSGSFTTGSGFAGTAILSGANTYTGSTVISTGTLQIGNESITPGSGTTGSLSTLSSITNNATLAFKRSNTITQGTDFNSVISGTGSVVQKGTGTLVLSGTNTYTGATVVDTGTLQIGNGGTTGSLSTLSSITNNATLAFNRSNTITQGTDFNSVISGTGSLVQNGTGTLNLTGANTYAGTTLVSAGTLLVNGGQTGTGLLTVSAAGTLGGNGSIAGSLHFDSGSKFVFSLTDTFTVNGVNVTFDGFGVSSLVGLDSSVAVGTYVLIDGSATFDFTNVSNFGVANAFDLGGGKSAYFQAGSLGLVVVPEPSAWVLAAIGLTTVVVLRRRRQIG